jgi:ADP-ribose pyrophosphatase
MDIPQPISKQPMPDHAHKVFTGVLFDVYQWEQELYDGRVVTFEKLKRPDTVVVFAVTEEGKILLTRQEQPGKAPFVSATGGRVDAGEDVLTAAKRELLEESGYEATDYVLWDARQPVSKIDWSVYTFIARGAKLVADLALDGGEKITLLPVTFDEFIELGTTGDFADSEIVPKLLRAKYDPAEYEKLKELFLGKNTD